MTNTIEYRTQNDGRGDEISQTSAIDFTGTESLTRQEDRDSTDINLMLSRFGVLPPPRAASYGLEVDYSLDLQQALTALQEAEEATLNVPQELRDKYGDWRTLMAGVQSGQYEYDLTALAVRKAEEKKEAEKSEPVAPVSLST